jgi:hypothetical protein
VCFQESIAINKSLFVLRNVIKSLAGATGGEDVAEDEADGDGVTTTSSAHFRDSKLTALLKHSLGGNSLTLMVLCIIVALLSEVSRTCYSPFRLRVFRAVTSTGKRTTQR